MRVALCFSGGIKYPENGLKSIEKIFPNCEIKIFMHTWDIHKKNDFLMTVHGLNCKEIEKTVTTDFNFLSNYNYEKLLIENYDSKKEVFENIFDSLNFKEYPTTSDGRTIGIGMISMHYSIWRSNELKKEYENDNNCKFDLVIRMRYDSEFPFTLNARDYVDNPEEMIYIPWGDDWLGGINDQFAIGNSEIIDVYSNIFTKLNEYQHLPYHPETILRNHLNANSIKIKRINYPVRINNGQDFRKDIPPEVCEDHFRQYSPDYQR